MINKKMFERYMRGTALVLGLMAVMSGCAEKAPLQQQPPVVINVNSKNIEPGRNGVTLGQPVAQAPTSGVTQPTVAQGIYSQPQPAVAQQQVYQTTAQAVVQQPVANSPNMPMVQPMLKMPRRQQAPAFDVEHMDEASFLNTQIHEMAMQLLKNFRGDVGPDGPIVVTTFVDLNNLYRTSPFGRYIAEQLMGELQRAGFNVVEIRKTETLMIKPQFGEYGLSREIQEIAKQSSAKYVLTGTYVTRGRFIMVNARLVSNENNMVASSGLKILRRDPFLEKMLWPTAVPGGPPAVRIPIKELGSLTEVKMMSGS